MSKIFVKVKFTNRKSFLELPRKLSSRIVVIGKQMEHQLANRLLFKIRKGLRRDSLGLIKLSPETVARKQEEGNPLPSKPMYGKGVTDPRSYYSLLRVMKYKKSTTVGFQRNVKHHSGITMKKLAIMHADGSRKLPRRNPIAAGYKLFQLHKEIRRFRTSSAKNFSENFSKGIFFRGN